MPTTYEADVVTWANEQAQFLRAGRFDLLDLQNLAGEIEDVGKSEQRELANRMAVLLAHLLKWQYQPERRGSSWEKTIKAQRIAVQKRVRKTPGLQPSLIDAEWVEDAWNDAKTSTEKETGIPFGTFPDDCPWPMAQVLDNDWFPV